MEATRMEWNNLLVGVMKLLSWRTTYQNLTGKEGWFTPADPNAYDDALCNQRG